MKRGRDRLEVIIRVHAEDGEVYEITDKRVTEPVIELAEKKVDSIDWGNQPHHKDDEDVTQLLI
tara:strand:+ start:1083 stop:1274 length:192 start_codon:yes stop_codon:yes gene_type:complete